MKNVKNTLFVATAALAAGLLAALLSGCDGTGGDLGTGDAGDAGRADSGARGEVSKPGTCSVPASRRNLPGSDHLPSGYKTLVGVYGAVACSTQPATLVETPTDCAAPADGFEKTTALATAFCCVKTLTAYDPARVVFSQLSCSGSYYGKPSSITAGGVALCTEDGIFAGWEC